MTLVPEHFCHFWLSRVHILLITETLFLNDNDLTGSLDAFCGIDFEVFAANPCEQVLIECKCCNACCDGVHCNEL
jgi:hypothetical protein